MTRTTLAHRISWTGRTWNPGIFGCTLAGPECTSCYAATLAHRGMGPYSKYKGKITHKTAHGVTWTGQVFTEIDRVSSTAAALPKAKRDLVFLTSMADLFHKDVPTDFIIAVHAEMAMRPHLTFQVLTKRPDRMAGLYRDPAFTRRVRRAAGVASTLQLRGNIWPGTSVGDDSEAGHDRLAALCDVPTSTIRFVSVEPMLDGGPNLRGYVEPHPLTRAAAAQRAGRYPMKSARDEPVSPINLVIFGGEAKRTKRPARPFDVDAARQMIDYLDRCGPTVDVMVKQLGTHWAQGAGAKSRDGGDPDEWPEDLRHYHGLPTRLAAAARLGQPV